MNNSKSVKVFISCVLGAGIGTLVALQCSQYFWWLGMIVGGLIGYLSFEFGVVVGVACRAVVVVVCYLRSVVTIKKKLWKLKTKETMWCMGASVTLLVPFMAIATKIFGWQLNFDAILGILIGMLIGTMIFLPFNIKIPSEDTEDELKKNIALLKRLNPISVYLFYVPKGILFCLKGFVAAIKSVFVLIHSDIRLLCGMDAAIGSAVGYFTGNVFIGILVGGIFGIINFEVVSKRFLKLPFNNV